MIKKGVIYFYSYFFLDKKVCKNSRQNDASSAIRQDVLSPKDIYLADSMGKGKQDYINGSGNTDMEEDKVISNGCLLFYDSKELTIKAKERYLYLLKTKQLF